MKPSHQTFLAALEDHKRGNLLAAAEGYEAVLQQEPDHADAHHFWGMLALQLGQVETAIERIGRAIETKADSPLYYYNLGEAYRAAGEFHKAESEYRRAIRFKADFAEAWNNLGFCLARQQKQSAAIDCYRQAIAIQPAYQLAKANLGDSLLAVEKFDEAIANYRQVVTEDCEDTNLLANFGSAYLQNGDVQNAEKLLEWALRLDFDHAVARINLAIIYKQRQELSRAEETVRHVLTRTTYSAEAHNTLATILEAEGRVDEAIDAYRQALQIRKEDPVTHSNMLFAMNHSRQVSPETLLAEHTEYANRYCRLTTSSHQQAANNDSLRVPNPKKTMRIGYVSPDFKQHVCASFMEPLLANHDSNNVEVYCYAEVRRADEVTRRMQGYAHRWRTTWNLDDGQLADQIHADRIDILVDLAGHSAGNRLPMFALRPAPIQITYLGYPATTGMQQIDYRFTDEVADPAENDRWHTERLIRLPECFLCYQPVADAPSVVAAPHKQNGHITFGSFNRLTKIPGELVELWADILHSVPESRLLMKTPALEDALTRDRYLRQFARSRISPDRVEMVGFIAGKKGHLSQYGKIDIALDSYPYGGTTTTAEALWMGVPVVTLAKGLHASRVGASLLRQVGLDDLAAESEKEYVARAVDLAGNYERMETIRQTLRETMRRSALCDAAGFTRRLEEVYRALWIAYCEKQENSH